MVMVDTVRHWSGNSRRAFVGAAGANVLLAVSGCAGAAHAGTAARTPAGRGEEKEEGKISATADLMREHGVLDRLLLVYEASRRRLKSGQDLQPDALRRAAHIIREFIEQYHEKLEEEHVFPRFERAGRLVDLVGVLRHQHSAGRELTDRVLELAAPGSPADPERLAAVIDSFITMYRPHAAREDTVLFPAFGEVVGPTELAELGEKFETIEHQRFGTGGFSQVVDEVAQIERALGIYELDRFTPQTA